MSDPKFPPNPIPFDNYYDWLKEFVSDPHVVRLVNRYNAAEGRFRRETGSEDAYRDDDEAFNARNGYEIAGSKILEKFGWPNYRELTRLFKESFEKDRRNLLSELQVFCGIGKLIIEGGWPSQIPDFRTRIDEKENIREFIRKCSHISWVSGDLKVDLQNGNG